MENTKYGKRREGRWTPIRAKAQDTRANPNSWETHLVRKRWNIGLLRALSLRIMMMIICRSELFQLPKRMLRWMNDSKMSVWKPEFTLCSRAKYLPCCNVRHWEAEVTQVR